MFWGLVLEPGKRYSTTVEKSFHVSKAVLDCSSVRNDNEILNVMLETEGSEAILCNLCKQKGILQENLDLNFMTGDRLTFECRGNGRVHLSGYLVLEEDDEIPGLMDEESEEEEDESEQSAASGQAKVKKEKRKMEGPPDNPSKKKKVSADEDENDDDDISGSDEEASDLSEDVDVEDSEDEMDDDEDEDKGSDDDEDSPILNQQKKNQSANKKNATTPKKTPAMNGMTPKEQKSNKKTPGGGPAATPNTTPRHKQELENGVVIKDLKIGTGPPVKSGKTVGVRYLGKFKDGKVFDKSMKGDPFKFKLGRGDVIKGWDIGIQGMKVGGKRTIHCPPEVAYGAKGAPPKIPPNSSLVFEVEVISAN